jgi:hypothetical protein
MSTNEYNDQRQESVIAIVQTDEKFRAVELQEQNGTIQILWIKSGETNETSWQTFAAECGLSAGSTEQARSDDDNDKVVVIGFDSAGTAFYRVKTPAVEEKEIEAIVKLQAESRLPLPIEQMELAWRTSPTKNGQIVITMAAARKQNLQAFVDKVKGIQPAQILLDCEGTTKAFETLFQKNQRNAVIINAGTHNTQVCLIEDGKLSNSVALDMGTGDIFHGQTQETEIMERFVQDMRSVVDLFGHKQSAESPVLVLSDGSETYVSLVSAMRTAGLDARTALPETVVFMGRNKLTNEDLYKYRAPIGLALLALDSAPNKLRLFEHLYNPSGEEKNKYQWLTSKAVYAAAAVMLALFVLISFAVDIAKPGAIEKRIKESGSEADINLIMERQNLKKIVAQQRPDILDLISEITASAQSNLRSQRNERGGMAGIEGMGDRGGMAGRGARMGRGQNSGIELESFHFKKGQPVTITGTATTTDQLYSFEKKLEENKDIKEVKRSTSLNTIGTNLTTGTRSIGGRSSPGDTGAARGNRSRGVKFTITFHYKNFTE